VNLTARSKWLGAIAAAVAGWVFFGPGNSEPVEATHASARPTSQSAGAAREPATHRSAAAMLAARAQRAVDAQASGSLFAAHSWYVAPPPPPAPPVVTTPAPPPKPTAPPLPYQLIGTYTPAGEKTVFFLSANERVYDVHVGDTLDNTYHIDSYNNGQLVLTYKPLNLQQQLPLTGAGQ
jgi:hypothetical protein